MWDLNQGDEPIQEFCGHELVVNGLAVSPGRNRVKFPLGADLESDFPPHPILTFNY